MAISSAYFVLPSLTVLIRPTFTQIFLDWPALPTHDRARTRTCRKLFVIPGRFSRQARLRRAYYDIVIFWLIHAVTFNLRNIRLWHPRPSTGNVTAFNMTGGSHHSCAGDTYQALLIPIWMPPSRPGSQVVHPLAPCHLHTRWSADVFTCSVPLKNGLRRSMDSRHLPRQHDQAFVLQRRVNEEQGLCTTIYSPDPCPRLQTYCAHV